MRRLDLWTSVALILIALAGIFWIIPRETVPGEPGEIAPADLPQFALWVVLICATAQIFTSLKSDEQAVNPMDRFAVIFLLASLALLFATLSGIWRLGYVWGGVLCVLAIGALMRPTRSVWPWLIGVAIVLPVALYWLTWHGLRLSLP